MIPFKHHQSFQEALESNQPITLQQLVELLKIPPKMRRIKDINRLRVQTRHVKFFKDQNENQDLIHYESCQSMKYEIFSAKDVIKR